MFIMEFVTCLALLLLAFWKDRGLFYVLLPLAFGAIGYTAYKFFSLSKDIALFLKNMSSHLDADNLQNMFALPMPVVVVSDHNEIVWYNDVFREQVMHGEDVYGMDLERITYTSLEKLRDYPGHIIQCEQKYYKIYTVDAGEAAGGFHMFYLIDVTELKQTYDLYHRSRPVVMMILIDSYEEIFKNIRESERSQILSGINRLLEQHIGKTHGFVERLERDKYLAVLEKQHFDQMVEHRFPILDEAKNIISSERVPVTLSLGAAYQGDSLEKNEADARQALEMSLGRGGDQAAVKTTKGFEFYGGVSKGVEKRTKVKSRILASAMLELIESSDNILIMGHRFADLDALGSAIGLARACACSDALVNIVIDRNKCLAGCLIDYYESFEGKGLFISPFDALNLIRKNTLLFVVDTHSAHMLESEDVYRECRNIVVIDHHRKMVDYIDNAVIFFHEPYASSTSEMVTELVQYLGDQVKLKHYHAEALLAGIMLDTKDFVMKTGVRTFEAAAYLKKMGADSITVKGLFASSMEDYKDKTKLVANAEIYKKCAIVCSDLTCKDIRIVAPQAADELLGICGVDASFVLFEQNNVININARSRGAMNVQVIMEELGGGGHQTMAGAQIPNAEMAGVKRLLLQAIDEYTAN